MIRSKNRSRQLLTLAWAAAAIAFLMWPVDRGLQAVTVNIDPVSYPLVTEQKLIILKVVAPNYSRVERGDALLQVYTDSRAIDEALAASEIQAMIPKLKQASGGVETATIKQLRQKLVYLQRILSRARKNTFVYAPRAGYVVYQPNSPGVVKPVGAPLGEILDPAKVTTYLDVPPEVGERFKVKGTVAVTGIERKGPAPSRLYLDGEEAGSLDLPTGIKQAQGKSGLQDFSSIEYWVRADGASAKTDKGTLPVVPKPVNEFKGEIERISWENRVPLGKASTEVRNKTSSLLKGLRVKSDRRNEVIRKLDQVDLSVRVWQSKAGEQPIRTRLWVKLPSPWLADAAISCRTQGQVLRGQAFVKTGSRPRWRGLFDSN